MERDDYADYILVFGSRDAANAALKLGLTFRKKSRGCMVYEPNTQWHQQCSHCQGHSHTAKDCQSSPFCGKCGYKHATQYCTSATFECANCHGAHMASSKKCPEWLKAENKAHRSYRFPAEDSEAQAPTPKIATGTSLPPPMSPLPGGQKPQETRNTKPEIALPPPKSSQTAIAMAPATLKPENNAISNKESQPATHNPPAPLDPSPKIPIDTQTHPSPPSALLQTIDEFRAFVAARENSKQSSKKRKEREFVMAGGLQNHDHGRDGKRVKREDEGPVWPIGQRDYRPPSLRVRRLEG